MPTQVHAQDEEPTPTPFSESEILTADDLLLMVNNARLQVGHPAMILDPILMVYSQEQAERTANSMKPDGKGATPSVIEMGYGYPETIDTIFCTSSNAILDTKTPVPYGFGTVGERAVNNIYYRHIGFGISKGVGEWEGYVIYYLTACYTADNLYEPGQETTPGSTTSSAISDLIIPVRTNTPLANGNIYHEVLSGQTLWAIAIAYGVHIVDILNLNQLPLTTTQLRQGQKLWIPTPQNIEITATPPLPDQGQVITFLPLQAGTATPEPTESSAETTALPQEEESTTINLSTNTIIIGAILVSSLLFFLGNLFKR